MYSFPSSPSDPAARAAAGLYAKFLDPKDESRKRESIPEHTENVLAVYEWLRARYEPLLDEGEDFWKDLKVAILFHDAGKFVRNFQDENLRAERGIGRNWERYVRHEFISCVLLLHDYRKLAPSGPDAFFAVAGHHKRVRPELFARDQSKVLDYRDEDLAAITGYLTDRLAREGIDWTFDGTECELLEESQYPATLNDLKTYVNKKANKRPPRPGMIDHYRGDDLPTRRLRYARLLGLLHACDWAGSGKTVPPPPLEYDERDLIAYMKKKISAFEAWRDFQSGSRVAGDVLAMAPTGSGKTEAALLWAARRPPGTRIVYCLPTKVTSNAIYERLTHLFPHADKRGDRATVGVVHGGAKNYRILEDEEGDYQKFNYLKDQTFARDVTVSTVDQLLTVGFNQGHWQSKLLHLQGASIVIDEIHLYQAYTLALILEKIKYLKNYCGCRFYVMTATLPDKLRVLLLDALGPDTVQIDDAERLLDARNDWEYTENDLSGEELPTRVLAQINDPVGKRVLIVRNTVDDCIATYQRFAAGLSDEHKCCLHSRFTQKDRLEKEKKVTAADLPDRFLLVATQVVEVSLDIDFDIIFTENAPVDALIQRAGRVNRRGKKKGTRVVVFPASENAERMYGKEVDNVIGRTADALRSVNGERITEGEMIGMVNGVYADFDVEETEGFRKGTAAYRVYQERFLIYDSDWEDEEGEVNYTRDGIDSVAVVPWCLTRDSGWEAMGGPERSQYTVPVSKQQLKRLEQVPSEEKGDWLVYIDSPYDKETGLYIPSWKEISEGSGDKPAFA